MKAALRRLYVAATSTLIDSKIAGAIIGFQHRNLPIPLPLFELMFRNRSAARLLAFYGHHVFWTDYGPRASNEDYWLGNRSAYWHLFRGHDVTKEFIAGVPHWPGAPERLLAARVICEPGFGLGSTVRAMIDAGLIKPEKVIGLEPIAAVRSCAEARCRAYPISIFDGGLDDVAGLQFDTLMLREVLMFFDPDTVAAFFAKIPAECKRVFIMNEGCAETIGRDDDTYMHGLPALVRSAGFEPTFTHMIDAGTYRLFVAERA